jgi:hypothetical protein
MKSSLRLIGILGFAVLAFGLSGCATLGEQLAETDRSLVNHPAMDLSTPRTPSSNLPLTALNTFSASSGSSGCAVCAH